MGAKTILNINTNTATDIIDYFRDIIGSDLEEILYTLNDLEQKNIDKKNIDTLMRQTNLTNSKEIKKKRSDIIYDMLKNSTVNAEYYAKIKILYLVYIKYYKILSQPENSKRMNALKDAILEGKGAMLLSHYFDEGKLKYEMITKEQPKSIESIKDNQSRNLLEIAINSAVSVSDLDDVVKYEGLSVQIIRKCVIDFLRDIGKSEEELKETEQNPIFENAELILDPEQLKLILGDTKGITIIFDTYLAKYLKSNLQLLNTDKLLMRSAMRLMAGIKVNEGEKIDGIVPKKELQGEALRNGIRRSIACLRDFYTELAKKPKNRYLSDAIYGQNGEMIISINLEEIKEFLDKCTTDRYYSEQDIVQIHEQVEHGILPEDWKVREIAQINIKDLINASISYEKINDEETKNKLLSCNLELIKYLKEKGEISNHQELIELYLNGDLILDILEKIELPEMLEEDYIENFKTIYEKSLEDEKDIYMKKLARCSELYKKLISNAKLNRNNLIENLVEIYGEERGNAILIDLYNLGMIELEECIDWAGTDILRELFEMENRNIQPSQINSLYHNKMLSLNEITDLILRIPNREERYITIASIFPEVSESEERQELIYKTIEVDKTINKKGKMNKDDEENKELTNGNNDYNKHITDSTYRFNLIRLLDQNYFMEMAADGHAIIKLPRFKKVMIEKMLDTKKEEGYGAATYILDENYYLSNEGEIKVDGKINRKELRTALEKGEATRIFHLVNSWGNQIKQFFEGIKQTKYTEKEQQSINNAIENIKNSVRVIGVGKND